MRTHLCVRTNTKTAAATARPQARPTWRKTRRTKGIRARPRAEAQESGRIDLAARESKRGIPWWHSRLRREARRTQTVQLRRTRSQRRKSSTPADLVIKPSADDSARQD